jgi:hypothetical protein
MTWNRLVAGGLDFKRLRSRISRDVASDLQTTLSERRSRLAEQLANAIKQPFFRGKELRSANAASTTYRAMMNFLIEQ